MKWMMLFYKYHQLKSTPVLEPISGRMDKAPATETIYAGSIPVRVKPKTRKIGIHSFPAWRSANKRTVWSLHRVR